MSKNGQNKYHFVWKKRKGKEAKLLKKNDNKKPHLDLKLTIFNAWSIDKFGHRHAEYRKHVDLQFLNTDLLNSEIDYVFHRLISLLVNYCFN